MSLIAKGSSTQEKGVSLIEVLIAVVVISMAILVLVYASRTSVAGQLRSKVYGDAATATREAMENIQLLPFDSLNLLLEAPINHSQGSGVKVFASVRGLLPGDVSNMDDVDTSSLRYLVLRTEFKNKVGARVSKSFTTILYRP
jgi:prepilin-type N-terminal cleavage/methylation domain-containing protein